MVPSAAAFELNENMQKIFRRSHIIFECKQLMMMFRYLSEMGYNDLEIDFAQHVTYLMDKDTPREQEYKFDFPVIKEWKSTEHHEFSTNNIRSSHTGELLMAEMIDEGWLSSDL